MYLLSSSLRAGRLSHLLGHLLPPPLSWRWYMYCAFGGAVFWPARLQQSAVVWAAREEGVCFSPSALRIVSELFLRPVFLYIRVAIVSPSVFVYSNSSLCPASPCFSLSFFSAGGTGRVLIHRFWSILDDPNVTRVLFGSTPLGIALMYDLSPLSQPY